MPHPAWTDADLSTNPHAVADKARRVQAMFAAIARSYDLNNRLHSLWRDQAWRRAAVRLAEVKPTDAVADIACGTGDLSMAFAKAGAARVVGVDFTYEMLVVAGEKAGCGVSGVGCGVETALHEAALHPSPQTPHPTPHTLSYLTGDAMRLPLADASADIVSIAFGIRNVADPGLAVCEFFRVLRPGGRLVILEFSLPANRVLRGLYNFYFRHIMPRTASLIARDRSGAYKYLPRSVNTFINRDTLMGTMKDAGFVEVAAKPLTFGVAVVYRGVKR